MPGRSLAGVAIVQRPRLGLGQRHIFRDVLHWQARGDDEHIWCPAQLSDGNEIAYRVPAQRGAQCRARGEVCRHQQPCVAVGRRARDFLGGDRAVGAGLGLDDDGGLPLLLHVLRDDTREHVGDAARRIGNDDTDRPAREILLRLPHACAREKPEQRGRHGADTSKSHRKFPAYLFCSAERCPDLRARCR